MDKKAKSEGSQDICNARPDDVCEAERGLMLENRCDDNSKLNAYISLRDSDHINVGTYLFPFRPGGEEGNEWLWYIKALNKNGDIFDEKVCAMMEEEETGDESAAIEHEVIPVHCYRGSISCLCNLEEA